MHERGLTADVDDDTGHNGQLLTNLAKKYGFHQPHPAEPWHLELDPNRIPLAATQPAETLTQGDDQMADALTIEYEDGSKTIADPSGGIYNAGTPYFGTMHSLLPSEKQGFETAKALMKIDPDKPEAGY